MEKNINPAISAGFWCSQQNGSLAERDVFFTWPKNDRSEFLSFQWNISFLRRLEMKNIIDMSLKSVVSNASLA